MPEVQAPPPFDQSSLPPQVDQPDYFNLPNPEVFNQRAELVFAPYVNHDGLPVEAQNYDHLFADDDPTDKTVEGAAVRSPEGRGVVTDASAEYSIDILKRFETEPALDGRIKEIIARYNGGNQLASKDTLQVIRENKNLRMELGVYFLDKLESMKEVLPQRVAKNEQKNSTMPGYKEIPNLRSREYSSLLALAHLDGTFDPEKSMSEEIKQDENGNVIVGQHRAASEMLLFS